MNTAPFSAYPIVRAVCGANALPIGPPLGLDSSGQAPMGEAAVLAKALDAIPEALTEVSERDPGRLRAAVGPTEIDMPGAIATMASSLATVRDASAGSFAALEQLNAEQVAELERMTEQIRKPVGPASHDLTSRGIGAYARGLMEEAFGDLETVVNEDPYDALAWLHLGHISLAREKVDESAEAYGKAVRTALAPSAEGTGRYEVVGGYAHLGAARALSLRGDYAQAVGHAREAVSLVNRGDCHYELARTLLLAGERGESARTALLEAIADNPILFATISLIDADASMPEEVFAELREIVVQIHDELLEEHDETIQRMNETFDFLSQLQGEEAQHLWLSSPERAPRREIRCVGDLEEITWITLFGELTRAVAEEASIDVLRSYEPDHYSGFTAAAQAGLLDPDVLATVREGQAFQEKSHEWHEALLGTWKRQIHGDWGDQLVTDGVIIEERIDPPTAQPIQDPKSADLLSLLVATQDMLRDPALPRLQLTTLWLEDAARESASHMEQELQRRVEEAGMFSKRKTREQLEPQLHQARRLVDAAPMLQAEINELVWRRRDLVADNRIARGLIMSCFPDLRRAWAA